MLFVEWIAGERAVDIAKLLSLPPTVVRTIHKKCQCSLNKKEDVRRRREKKKKKKKGKRGTNKFDRFRKMFIFYFHVS